MTEAQTTIAQEVERYLRTGESDSFHSAWGSGLLERANRAKVELRGALIREVGLRAEGRRRHSLPDTDTIAFARARITPMVRGLFPRAEQAAVLTTLAQSVVFLTSANIENLLIECSFDHTEWMLANLYLASIGAELLGADAPHLAGLSEETTCYVSAEYFSEDDPFADYIVHEAAHIFHNCKRTTIGLRGTRAKEWLLEIDYRKRETFAYSCEAYARVLERGKSPSERQALAEEYGRVARIEDERADAGEIASIVLAAATARNGWKVILARCAPPRVSRLRAIRS